MTRSSIRDVVINLLGFKAGWLSCVLGAAAGPLAYGAGARLGALAGGRAGGRS